MTLVRLRDLTVRDAALSRYIADVIQRRFVRPVKCDHAGHPLFEAKELLKAAKMWAIELDLRKRDQQSQSPERTQQQGGWSGILRPDPTTAIDRRNEIEFLYRLKEGEYRLSAIWQEEHEKKGVLLVHDEEELKNFLLERLMNGDAANASLEGFGFYGVKVSKNEDTFVVFRDGIARRKEGRPRGGREVHAKFEQASKAAALEIGIPKCEVIVYAVNPSWREWLQARGYSCCRYSALGIPFGASIHARWELNPAR